MTITLYIIAYIIAGGLTVKFEDWYLKDPVEWEIAGLTIAFWPLFVLIFSIMHFFKTAVNFIAPTSKDRGSLQMHNINSMNDWPMPPTREEWEENKKND